MKLTGTQKIDAPPEVVWRYLTDRDTLARATPGCKALTEQGEDRYEALLELGVAAIKGSYKGMLSIEDKQPPRHYRLRIEGEGGPGFVQAWLDLDLEAQGASTLVRYDGEAQVGGAIAGVGQRVLGGVAKFLIGQFFSALAREVHQAEARS
ncbi:MAG TPA: carbon monoxide dehydrogenase subunit G [Bacillota bacterium]